MNVLVQRNESICAYDLRRVTEGWGMQTDDSHLMFALRPPWVKTKTYANPNGTGSQQGETSPAAP